MTNTIRVPGWGIFSYQDPTGQSQSGLCLPLLVLSLCSYDLFALLPIVSLAISWFGKFPALQRQPMSTEGPGRPPDLTTNYWASAPAITMKVNFSGTFLKPMAQPSLFIWEKNLWVSLRRHHSHCHLWDLGSVLGHKRALRPTPASGKSSCVSWAPCSNLSMLSSGQFY